MPRHISIAEFLQLRSQYPVVDMRSPKEFTAGHISGAVNIPILNDEERAAVGTDYKQKGQQAAVQSGIKLVGPRLAAIVEEASGIAKDKTLLVHCWRGGMRSGNFSWLIELAGISCINLQGGYKAYRQLATDTFEKPFQLLVITGATGSGKTGVLQALKAMGEQVIDLEALAKHKGSVFGGLGQSSQPTTEQFQNDLFEALHPLDMHRRIWIEDESIAIGKVFLPDAFWKNLRTSPLLQLQVDKSVRIKHLVEEYGKADINQLTEAIEKITKKLGGQHAKAAKEKLLAGDLATTVDILLTYYDKAYQNGLLQRESKIIDKFEYDGANAKQMAALLVQQISIKA
ncbi:MAG TPA: tRNA 2-selenouridine(34) synthase MnmH [Cyclobacteriaceae bacterium]|nr:tRNA 2-selenouridine(34) synthase MnmH [Cyclobacteriaceae bacterium]